MSGHYDLIVIGSGPAGQKVRQVLVEEGCDIAREQYLGIVVDRASAGPVLMASGEGGMNIEEVAAKTPELIYRERFHPDSGLLSFQARKLAAQLDIYVSGKAFGGPDNPNITRRHVGGANCMFMDGHAKWYTYNAIVWERSPEKEIWGHFTAPEGD